MGAAAPGLGAASAPGPRRSTAASFGAARLAAAGDSVGVGAPGRGSGDERIGALPEGLSRDALIAEVARAVADVPRSAGLMVAASGGPDSTALAHLLSLARPDVHLELIHVRHGLRDDSEDAAAAAAHAASLEAAYHEVEVEVRVGRLGPEAAAREARYDALLRRADATGTTWVAIGHTADDQAETVLINLVRGAGLRGLGGMRPVRRHGRIRVARPLLRIRRSDIAAFIDGEGLLAVADPTNRDPEQRRARARHEVLPVLERLAGGPGDAVASLNRLAELARIDTEALDALATEHASRLIVAWGATRALRLDLVRLLPRALSTRLLRTAAAAAGAPELSAAAVTRIFALQPGEALHVTGNVFVSCGGGWIGIAPPSTRPLEREALVIPGTTTLRELGLDLHVEWPWPLAPSADPGQLDLGAPDPPTIRQVGEQRPPGPQALPPPGAGPRARMWAVFSQQVGQDLVRGVDFTVRSRRNGDRLRCSVGMRKLQDLLVDAHVPRVCRDLIPVVVDHDDEPLWVPGVAQRAVDVDAAAGLRMWLAPSSTSRLVHPSNIHSGGAEGHTS